LDPVDCGNDAVSDIRDRSISPDSIDQNSESKDNIWNSRSCLRSSPALVMLSTGNSVSMSTVGNSQSMDHAEMDINRASTFMTEESQPCWTRDGLSIPETVKSRILLEDSSYIHDKVVVDSFQTIDNKCNQFTCSEVASEDESNQLQTYHSGVLSVQNNDVGFSCDQNKHSGVSSIENNNCDSSHVTLNSLRRHYDSLQSCSRSHPDSSVNTSEIFSCAALTLVMTKSIAVDSLDVLFHIKRQCDTDSSVLDDATMSFEAADSLAITVKQVSFLLFTFTVQTRYSITASKCVESWECCAFSWSNSCT